jgi:hypothetical protein
MRHARPSPAPGGTPYTPHDERAPARRRCSFTRRESGRSISMPFPSLWLHCKRRHAHLLLLAARVCVWHSSRLPRRRPPRAAPLCLQPCRPPHSVNALVRAAYSSIFPHCNECFNHPTWYDIPVDPHSTVINVHVRPPFASLFDHCYDC